MGLGGLFRRVKRSRGKGDEPVHDGDGRGLQVGPCLPPVVLRHRSDERDVAEVEAVPVRSVSQTEAAGMKWVGISGHGDVDGQERQQAGHQCLGVASEEGAA